MQEDVVAVGVGEVLPEQGRMDVELLSEGVRITHVRTIDLDVEPERDRAAHEMFRHVVHLLARARTPCRSALRG